MGAYKKMSDEKWDAAYSMRYSGKTFKEIADALGVSVQTIATRLSGVGDRSTHRYQYKRCIYPNLSKFLKETHSSYNDFANQCGVSLQAMFNCLTGKVDPRKSTIDAILDHTGFYYEYAFQKKEVNP